MNEEIHRTRFNSIDIMFLVDTTASMGGLIADVKNSIGTISQMVKIDYPNYLIK